MYDYNIIEIAIRTLMYALSVFRFTMLLYNEDGPWSIFDWLRFKAGVRIEQVVVMSNSPDESYQEWQRTGEGFFAELLNCPYCISGWLSLLMLVGLVTKWLPFELLASWGAIWFLSYWLAKREGL